MVQARISTGKHALKWLTHQKGPPHYLRVRHCGGVIEPAFRGKHFGRVLVAAGSLLVLFPLVVVVLVVLVSGRGGRALSAFGDLGRHNTFNHSIELKRLIEHVRDMMLQTTSCVCFTTISRHTAHIAGCSSS